MSLKSEAVSIVVAHTQEDLPEWLLASDLAQFIHRSLMPYEDSLRDIGRALDRVLLTKADQGGFIILASHENTVRGALVIHFTPWAGYVPENLLLYVAVAPQHRGCGLGTRLIKRALAACSGDVKLHVEYDNPAISLYERIGFTSKYAEMRCSR